MGANVSVRTRITDDLVQRDRRDGYWHLPSYWLPGFSLLSVLRSLKHQIRSIQGTTTFLSLEPPQFKDPRAHAWEYKGGTWVKLGCSWKLTGATILFTHLDQIIEKILKPITLRRESHRTQTQVIQSLFSKLPNYEQYLACFLKGGRKASAVRDSFSIHGRYLKSRICFAVDDLTIGERWIFAVLVMHVSLYCME